MYDNVCKFMAEMFSEDFANWLLGTPISLTKLKPTELSLEPIRADSLIFLQSDEVVLHIEFQTEPDESLPFAWQTIAYGYTAVSLTETWCRLSSI